ncbi:MAG: hypothetical protein ACFFCV_18775 [Promethearchaeota archaeon]
MSKKQTPQNRKKLSFKRAPARSGSGEDDYHFKIPRVYIENKLVDVDKTYIITLGNSNITFRRSPSKMSSISEMDYSFKIPRIYIRNNLVEKNKTYKVILEELPSGINA